MLFEAMRSSRCCRMTGPFARSSSKAICSSMAAPRSFPSTWEPSRPIASTRWSRRITPATFLMSRQRCLGRPDVAAAAKLSIMAAGDAGAIDRVQPLFDAMGQKTYRVGSEPRQANIAKIAGNLMVACAIEAIAEAAALLRKYRMSAPDVLDVIITSLFNVPVYQGYGRAIGRREYVPPGFDLVLGMKDVGLALKAGEQANVPLPFASVLRDAFIDAIANGDAGKDWSAIARVAARKAGLQD